MLGVIMTRLFLRRIRNGLFKQNSLRATHAALVSRLTFDEATLAHNEITYGGFQMGLPCEVRRTNHFRENQSYIDIETATTLYEYVMRLRGSPISLQRKARYRIGLAWAVTRISNDREKDFGKRIDRASKLLQPYVLGHLDGEIKNRENLNEVVLLMRRAVR